MMGVEKQVVNALVGVTQIYKLIKDVSEAYLLALLSHEYIIKVQDKIEIFDNLYIGMSIFCGLILEMLVTDINAQAKIFSKIFKYVNYPKISIDHISF